MQTSFFAHSNRSQYCRRGRESSRKVAATFKVSVASVVKRSQHYRATGGASAKRNTECTSCSMANGLMTAQGWSRRRSSFIFQHLQEPCLCHDPRPFCR